MSVKEMAIKAEMANPKWQNLYDYLYARNKFFYELELILKGLQRNIDRIGLNNVTARSFRQILDDKPTTKTYFCDSVHYTYHGYTRIVEQFRTDLFPWILDLAMHPKPAL